MVGRGSPYSVAGDSMDEDHSELVQRVSVERLCPPVGDDLLGGGSWYFGKDDVRGPSEMVHEEDVREEVENYNCQSRVIHHSYYRS